MVQTERPTNLVRLWWLGLWQPSRAFQELAHRPAPLWGLWAVLIGFVVTALTTTLALYLLGREPFTPSYLTFVSTERYYQTLIFFFPLFGLAAWLLASAVVHLILRLTHHSSDFDRVLNVVGWGRLIPMPVVWLWDWSALGLGLYQMSTMAISHSLFELWEIGVGLRQTFGLGVLPALLLGLTVSAVYIPLAAIFVR